MSTLAVFNNFVNEIKTNNSRTHKLAVLSQYKDNEDITFLLNFIYNPYITTGLADKKLNKKISVNTSIFSSFSSDDIKVFLNWLAANNTGSDEVILSTQLFRSSYIPAEYHALFNAIVTKTLAIGIDVKTINKAIPGCCPEFSVQLANKYFDRPAAVENKEFAITTKIDGFRLITIKDADGNVKFYSRVGQPIEGLVEIEEEIRNLFPNNIALDGELTIDNYFDMSSKDAYKAASKIIRLKDAAKTGLTYRLFDCMTADEFKSQQCDKTYDERRVMLESLDTSAKHIEVLPVLYRGTDAAKITEILDDITANDGEGCMINICSAKYTWNRTWNLLKVKKFNTYDLEIIDFEEGTGKNLGTLGAILCKYKDNNVVKVGSGFTDEQRAEIWANKAAYKNTIVEISYFEETTNAQGGTSLRFPTFKDFRADKNQADF